MQFVYGITALVALYSLLWRDLFNQLLVISLVRHHVLVFASCCRAIWKAADMHGCADEGWYVRSFCRRRIHYSLPQMGHNKSGASQFVMPVD